MDEINRWILARLSEKFPNHSIHLKPMFLGGPQSECGFVPSEWNGRVIESGPMGYVEL